MKLKKQLFRQTVLAHALTIAFGTAALTVGVVQPVMAQSNAAGTIFGRVDAPAGASINLRNTDTGLQRKVTLDANGRYQATAMPTGHYKVELVRGDKVVDTTELDVIVGQGVDASFTAAAVQSVQVTGRRSRIDVSSTNNGATFSARELAKLPIAQSVDAIIQLAPNTTRADPRYAAGASFGGGAPSENAYYINGFPVTNPLTQLGASELPFGAISQAQVMTGGFGAEFGRSIGGVVNITTKSGTNNWEFGVMGSIEPSSLRAKDRDIYYGNTGDPANKSTDGTLYRRRSDNETDLRKIGGYVGGPIIKDKLFMFVSVEGTRNTFSGVQSPNGAMDSGSIGTAGWTEQKDNIDRYMGKFDWNITDNHRLELTLIGDKSKRNEKLSGYDYATHKNNGIVTSEANYTNIANQSPTVGADVNVLKYTGNLTDDLTITTLYGKMTTDHTNDLIGYNPNLFQIVSSSAVRAPGLTYNNPQPLTGSISPTTAQDTVKSFRFDVEYKLGSHTLRAGLDDNKLVSVGAGDSYAGGGQWRYFKASGSPTTPIAMNTGPLVAPASGGGLGLQGYYVRKRLFNDITSAYSDQSAQYIEDRYQITKDILVTAGLRSEEFINKNGDGASFLEQKHQIAPRLGAAWDVNGDASTKVFGSLGRYHVQIPTHLAVRGASRSLYTEQFYTYTGVDANGVPTGLVALTQPRSSNNEFGQAKDPRTVTATDLKPNYQDEITLGLERAFSADLNFGAKVTYRQLKSTIDDFCDPRPFEAYAAKNKIAITNPYGVFGCASFNPGEANSFLVDFVGNQQYTLVNLSAADLGFEKAERTYTAVDLFAEHPLRGGWYGKVNYTWSRSKGNTEGQTLSDVAQTDVAATQTWDYHELMEYNNGLLPSNRTHQIKAYGFYEVLPELTVGGNLLLATGRPSSCIGNYPGGVNGPDYGSAHHYCDGKPAPRGTAGDLPSDMRLDMNLVYRPAVVKGLALKMDVFNITNRQTVQAIDEVYNVGDQISPTYRRVISYTAPRSVRLTAEYNYKF